jgi:hypothetical protein
MARIGGRDFIVAGLKARIRSNMDGYSIEKQLFRAVWRQDYIYCLTLFGHVGGLRCILSAFPRALAAMRYEGRTIIECEDIRSVAIERFGKRLGAVAPAVMEAVSLRLRILMDP